MAAIRHSGDDYAAELAALLPTGAAWPRDPESALMLLVAGLAQIWGDVDGRANDLLEIETDPQRTTELLPEWERAFGLPETCARAAAPDRFRFGWSETGVDAVLRNNRLAPSSGAAPTLSLEQRRAALVAKLQTPGGQDRATFIALAQALGRTITIDEFSPFKVGMSRLGDTRKFTGSRPKWFRLGISHVGVDPHLTLPSDFKIVGDQASSLGNPKGRAAWRVNVAGHSGSGFRVGLGGGELGVTKLLTVTPKPNRFGVGVGGGHLGQSALLHVERATDLECLFERLKPAASSVSFNYGQIL